MQENNLIKFEELNKLIQKLWNEKEKRKSLNIAIKIANELMSIFGIKKEYLSKEEEVLNKAFAYSKFKNQNMEFWFKKHPYFKGARVAQYLYTGNEYPIQSNFFWLNNDTKQERILDITKLTSNWEDSELTRLPQYKVGINFILNSVANKLSMVITNHNNLRKIDFSEKLSNIQIKILNKLKNCINCDGIDPNTKEKVPFEPQENIHRILWNSLEE